MISDKAVKEFKEIFKKKYGVELSDADAREQGQRLMNYVEIVYKHAERDLRRKKRLKDENIKGFYLENEDGHYTCAVCKDTHIANDMWWNPDGIRCRDCWRNIKNGVIPSLTYENEGIWIPEWELQSYYGVHHTTRAKLKREGLLKGRDLKRENGTIYCTVYLVKENKEFLKKYPKKKPKPVV
jgi:hypothetical protein